MPLSKHQLKFSFKHIFALLGLVGLIVVLLLSRHEFTSFWHLLGGLRWYVLAGVVVIQLASYWINGLYYRSILRVFSCDLSTKRLFEGALATNFVNYVLPSVGLAGAGYLSQVLAPEVPRGESFLTQIMRYAFSALAVLVMLPVGFLFIVLSGESGHVIVKITLASIVGIIIFAGCILLLVQSEATLRRFCAWLVKTLKKIRPQFDSEQKFNHFIDEFYVGYRAMVRQKRKLSVPFFWSIIYILIEILTFYMAFLAFGKVEAIGIVIMAYLFANIASIFGGVFFSTGIFELGMAGTLVALGTPFVLAVSVTTVYRVLNLLIGLPPGYYFYRKYL